LRKIKEQLSNVSASMDLQRRKREISPPSSRNSRWLAEDVSMFDTTRIQ
jgi:hypothetical protein